MADRKLNACDVCGGEGDYPVIDMHGEERYSIRCPECYGSGTIEPEPEPEEQYEYGPSTAARIKSMDELRTLLTMDKR